MLGPDGGELLEGTGGDVGMGQELIQVVLVGFTGMGGGGAEQPGVNGPADGLAEIAGHLAGKRRDRVGGDHDRRCCSSTWPSTPTPLKSRQRPRHLVRITHFELNRSAVEDPPRPLRGIVEFRGWS